MKRNRATDTQPMLDRPPSPESTAPLGQAERTDPGGPPTTTLPPPRGDATLPGAPPMTTLPPSGTTLPPTPAATQEEIDAANNLLAAFKGPLTPPAPRPKQQATSNGGDFVAYSGVARPVAPYAAGAPDPSLVQVELARLAALPDSRPPEEIASPSGRRDHPTVLITASRRKRGRILVIGIGAGLLVGSIMTAALTLRSRTAPPSPAASVVTAPSLPIRASAEPMQPPIAATPSAPIASSAGVQPPSVPFASAALSVAKPGASKVAPSFTAPAAASPRDPRRESHGATRPAQPSKPDDGFHW